LISAFVGESEKAVKEAFEEARRDGAVLILDEADSFLANRQTAVRSWEVTLVNELLQQIEAFDEGVFVATTNALDRLDEATMRRFDLKLEFRFLQPGQARELMRRCCERLGVYENGCETLVTSMDRLTPGDFATVVRQARFRPARSADEVARRLREEVGFKRGPRQAIGFGPVVHQAH
jgi:transitional endoplasmic reticulum ATPase